MRQRSYWSWTGPVVPRTGPQSGPDDPYGPVRTGGAGTVCFSGGNRDTGPEPPRTDQHPSPGLPPRHRPAASGGGELAGGAASGLAEEASA
jgi:hypothetical protein